MRYAPGAVFATSLYCIAFSTTIYRIFVRIRIQRWGWDDTWAMVAALNALGFFASLWVPVSQGTRIVYYSHNVQS
jgi:hypothetical protein